MYVTEFPSTPLQAPAHQSEEHFPNAAKEKAREGHLRLAVVSSQLLKNLREGTIFNG